MDLEPHSLEHSSDDADSSLSGLQHHLKKSLHVHDIDGKEHMSDEDDSSDLEEENDFVRRRLYHAKSELGWPSKSTVHRSFSKMFNTDSSSEEDEEQLNSSSDEPTTSAHFPSLPSPSSLVSAMKGSREKQGRSPRKLTVTWAPDVYDPTPSSPSQMLSRGTKKQKVPKEKLAEKKGQKGKGHSRGAGGKDSSRGVGGRDKKKKQHRRVVRSFNSFEDDDDEY